MSAKKIGMFCAMLLGTLLAVAAGAAETVAAGHGVRYFLTFTGKTLPFKPVDEVSRDEALSDGSYCIVEYQNGRIVRFIKMANGKRSFEHRFTWFRDGVMETYFLIRMNGSTSRFRYDQPGDLVESSE